MRKIAITNQKGGVGKTTTAVNLTALFDERGERALLVDFDPQGSATATTLGQPARDEGEGLMNALDGKVPLTRVARRIRYLDRAQVLPAGTALARATHQHQHLPGCGHYALRDALARSADAWDVVIIDCPPVDLHLIHTALAAADFVVIPTLLETAASRGIGALTATIRRVTETTNPSLKVAGVLPTKVVPKRRNSAQVYAQLQEVLGDEALMRTYIRDDVAVPEMDFRARPVVRRRSSRAASDYRDALSELEQIMTA